MFIEKQLLLTFGKQIFEPLFHLLRMLFTTAVYIDHPLAAYAAAAAVGKAIMVETKHATDLIINNIY